MIPGGSIPNPAKSVRMPKPGKRDYGKSGGQTGGQLNPMGYTNVGFGETGLTGET